MVSGWFYRSFFSVYNRYFINGTGIFRKIFLRRKKKFSGMIPFFLFFPYSGGKEEKLSGIKD